MTRLPARAGPRHRSSDARLLDRLPDGHGRLRLDDTESKGWIEVTVRWAGGQRAITFYDPTRLSQSVQDMLTNAGYFAEPAHEPPTYGIVMPTQPVDEPDTGTVDAFRTTIRAGQRPAALVLGWIEDRYVEAEYSERFLVGMLLDGHHKLLAYTTESQPARALLISRDEDSWGPPNNRTQWLDAVIANLRQDQQGLPAHQA